MKTQSYASKLKDPQWQKKRLDIMNRDNWTCQRCRSKENTLNVHHLAYRNEFENPWDYPNSFLVTICEKCHETEKSQFDNGSYDPLMQLTNSASEIFLSTEIDTLMRFVVRFRLIEEENEYLYKKIMLLAFEWAVSDITTRTEILSRYLKHVKRQA